jgi:hypothetical protein
VIQTAIVMASCNNWSYEKWQKVATDWLAGRKPCRYINFLIQKM